MNSHFISRAVFFILTFFLSFSLLILAYTLYRGPSGVLYFQFYLLVSIGGILLFGSSFFIKESHRINLAIFFISFTFTLYLAEIILTALNPLFFFVKGIDFDTKRMLEVVTDSRKADVEMFPPTFPSQLIARNGFENNGDRIFPLSGLSKKKTVFCNETGQYVIFDSDEHGFNNPRGLYRPSEVDILLVGDSYVHGSCVAPSENIASQLRNITKKNVLSIGMGSNGPLMELGGISEFATVLKPAKVLWFYFEGNDLSGFLNEMKSTVLMKYLKEGYTQDLFSQQKEVDRLWLEFIRDLEKIAAADSWRHSRLMKTVKLYNLRLRLGVNVKKMKPPPPTIPPLYKVVMNKAKKRVEAWGGELYFIYIPEWERYAKGIKNDQNHKKAVISILESLGIPVLDFHSVLKEHPDVLELFPFRKDGHFTSEGYALLAKTAVEWLEKENSSLMRSVG